MSRASHAHSKCSYGFFEKAPESLQQGKKRLSFPSASRIAHTPTHAPTRSREVTHRTPPFASTDVSRVVTMADVDFEPSENPVAAAKVRREPDSPSRHPPKATTRAFRVSFPSRRDAREGVRTERPNSADADRPSLARRYARRDVAGRRDKDQESPPGRCQLQRRAQGRGSRGLEKVRGADLPEEDAAGAHPASPRHVRRVVREDRGSGLGVRQSHG